ncbi:papilin [Caerostris darwini]|uniref:Papilin n=1 Tax=Caerostris darwini TaxID=1538125 RepID=A0AAV4UTK1_9ARAC|nr:papilin [Caerostris darwini]
MKLLVLFALVAGAVAFLDEDCPPNSKYQSCGTACPLTCENHKNPPKACVLMCNPGCHCDEGYVKTKDGKCVLPQNCPGQEVCGENERYTGCGTACPLTCDNYDNPPKICNLMCKIGCECQDGFVRSADGKCVLPEECPGRAEEESNCHDEADGGMCRGYFPMWYYDESSMDCKEFIYGGCQGNGNRYGSKEDCLKSCAHIFKADADTCDLPAETGRCRGFFPRYHFDKASGQCKRFVYGGCGGNANNFKTEDDCNSACGNRAAALDRPDCDKPAEPGLCRAYIPRYYYDQEAGQCKKFIYGGCGGNRNNFQTEDECYNKCGALASESACDQEKVVGPCRAAFRRFFFNKQTGQCERFIYGGCQGNSNNFHSQEDCEAVCLRQ